VGIKVHGVHSLTVSGRSVSDATNRSGPDCWGDHG
jgi:hypothetical protein